jgi:hypothetical protein
MHAFFAVLLLAAHLFVSSATTPQVLPARLVGRVLVAAQINGHELWFHLDTGTNGLYIDRTAASRAGMTIRDGQAHANLTIGTLSANDARFGLLDHFGNEDGSVYVSGLIGTPFFKSNVVTIDYLHQQLIVYPNGSFNPKAMNAGPTPIDFDGSVARIHVWFGQTRATMLLDTGAQETMLFEPFANTVALGAPLTQPEPMTVGIGTPPTFEHESQVLPMNVGGILIQRPVVHIVDEAPSFLSSDRFDGILGRDIYKLFRMTIDYGNGVIYLEH